MKKVIFICLLSLSMCLSRPDGEAAPPSVAEAAEAPASNPKTPAVPEQTKQTPNNLPNHPDGTQTGKAPIHPDGTQSEKAPNQSDEKQSGKAAETPAPALPNVPQNQTPIPHEPVDGKSTPKASNENKTVPDKKVPDASKDNQAATVNPPATTTNTTDKGQGNAATESAVTTSTVPNSTKKNETIPDKSDTSKTTEAPKHEGAVVQARGFDGASFIGGIILTLGLLAIGFMGFKYYKNQTERNYHTL